MSNDEMTLYLSGPMTGIQDHNFPLFNAVAHKLRAANAIVYNPAEHFSGRVDLPRHEYMAEDFRKLLEVASADTPVKGIVLLPGWTGSKGARAEVVVAHEVGLQFFAWQDERLQRTTLAETFTDTNVPEGVMPPTTGEVRTTDPKPDVSEGILEEALRITSGVRQQNYGKPETNHNRIALLWAAWDVCAWCDDKDISAALEGIREVADLRCADRGLDVAMKMILLKIAREANAPKRDNLVDIAGYARVISRIHGYEE